MSKIDLEEISKIAASQVRAKGYADCIDMPPNKIKEMMMCVIVAAVEYYESAKTQAAPAEKRLKTAIGGLRSIAYGDARTWPKEDARLCAIQTLQDCGGEKTQAAPVCIDSERQCIQSTPVCKTWADRAELEEVREALVMGANNANQNNNAGQAVVILQALAILDKMMGE